MIRLFPLTIAAGLALLAAPFSGAAAPYSVTHNGPITVRILSGEDGQPFAHVHLLLLGGYDQRQIDDKLWREEAITDAHGEARLSKQFANLPWLQVWVRKKRLCQAKPRAASFSVELMLRDGVSAPNRCGTFTVEETPGVFTVFVKGVGKSDLPEPSGATKTAPIAPTTAAAEASQAAVVPAPASPAAPVVTAAPVALPPAAPEETAFKTALPEWLEAPASVVFPSQAPASILLETPVSHVTTGWRAAPDKARMRHVARMVVRRRRARPVQAACRAPRERAKPAAAPAKAESKPAVGTKPSTGAPDKPVSPSARQ
jgi:hypothetical protein